MYLDFCTFVSTYGSNFNESIRSNAFRAHLSSAGVRRIRNPRTLGFLFPVAPHRRTHTIRRFPWCDARSRARVVTADERARFFSARDAHTNAVGCTNLALARIINDSSFRVVYGFSAFITRAHATTAATTRAPSVASASITRRIVSGC